MLDFPQQELYGALSGSHLMLGVALIRQFLDDSEAEFGVKLSLDDLFALLLKLQLGAIPFLLVKGDTLIEPIALQTPMSQRVEVLGVQRDTLGAEFDLKAQILSQIKVNEAGMLKVDIQR